ncbi:hypothetical protein BDN67DRAFT_388206 [Paxillus ammoniavirescens]|nr:hypothetical protein BDN67DRAFT_388206 [Paxillus ammoniavirescens]
MHDRPETIFNSRVNPDLLPGSWQRARGPGICIGPWHCDFKLQASSSASRGCNADRDATESSKTLPRLFLRPQPRPLSHSCTYSTLRLEKCQDAQVLSSHREPLSQVFISYSLVLQTPRQCHSGVVLNLKGLLATTPKRPPAWETSGPIVRPAVIIGAHSPMSASTYV